MKVDAVKLISGIKPALLKGLLRKDRFDTPTAMNWLGLDEPKVTTTLKTILLFGSLLTGGRDGSIGDIDVVVEIGRRDLTESVRKVLEKAEEMSKPAGSNLSDSLHWPEILIRRHLAKISRYLSFHPASDLQIGTTSYS
jgi:predicted nucleotidyltransferase